MLNDEAKLAKESATNSVMLQHVQSAYHRLFENRRPLLASHTSVQVDWTGDSSLQ